MESKYILAIDAGTSGVRAVIYDQESNEVAIEYSEFTQITPAPSLLEHDPMEIWNLTEQLMRDAVKKAELGFEDIAAIGLATQRSTAVAWDKNTGLPVYNAIVWQDLRTYQRCLELTEIMGISISPFSTYTKYEWLLNNVPNCKENVQKGDVLIGTMDSWLLWKLTGGEAFVTDPSNAVGTNIWNPITGDWDEGLAGFIGLSVDHLAKLVSSSEVYGTTVKSLFNADIPVAAVAGDQQSAMFGHLATKPGEGKATYGTSVMVDVNTGTNWISSENSFPLALWRFNGQDSFCLEGQVVTGGATMSWVKELNILQDIEEVFREETMPKGGGVYFVPALQGLGTPYMDPSAKGAIFGLTRATTRQHVVKAVLEAVAFRTRQVVESLREKTGEESFATLQVDGGMSKNDYFMQMQADILGINVERQQTEQVTALGIAYLAGLAVGYWKDEEEIRKFKKAGTIFIPRTTDSNMEARFQEWKNVVDAVRSIPTVDV
ncbi:glycerol kinase GlpK [Sporosarcina sp.]|uniref:FGGY family carbohydrate kinase n=1 Tax=Sporosarcina sp. TaxID=49982 RepID=UPI002605FB69|nr:glycerol kinase GlpK [Sporosarcina sp.]